MKVIWTLKKSPNPHIHDKATEFPQRIAFNQRKFIKSAKEPSFHPRSKPDSFPVTSINLTPSLRHHRQSVRNGTSFHNRDYLPFSARRRLGTGDRASLERRPNHLPPPKWPPKSSKKSLQSRDRSESGGSSGDTRENPPKIRLERLHAMERLPVPPWITIDARLFVTLTLRSTRNGTLTFHD